MDTAVDVLGADDRVVALFAVGSVGRGLADASSDLDLVVALADQAGVQDVCGSWETLIEQITPTVYRRLLGTQIVTVVTPSWERLDITFMPAAAAGLLSSGPATVLFDHGQTQPPMCPAAPVASAGDLVVRAENFIPRVRALIENLGGSWPEELFDATDRYLRPNVGVGFALDDRSA